MIINYLIINFYIVFYTSYPKQVFVFEKIPPFFLFIHLPLPVIRLQTLHLR